MCVQTFAGCIFRECPVSGFLKFSFMQPNLPEEANLVCYHCSNHTAAKEVLVHLTSDLSRYCHFRETLLTLSQVVNTFMIHLRRYVVAAFVAITCTNKSGHVLVGDVLQHKWEVRNRRLTRCGSREGQSPVVARFRATSPVLVCYFHKRALCKF